MHDPLMTVTSLASLIFATAIPITLCGCSPQSGGAPNGLVQHPTYKSSLIEKVPHIQQKPDFCGEACAAMYLNFLGEEVDQDYVFDAAGVDPSVGRGLIARELNNALTQIGFKTGTVWSQVRSKRDVHRQFAYMLDDLSHQIPSIVCMNTTRDASNTEHFRLVLGYDANTDEVIYHEPAKRNGAYQRMSADRFIKLWPLKASNIPDTVVRMRLEPGALSFGEKSVKRTAADYVQHVIGKQPLIPRQFQVCVEPPFVVIGNGSAEQVHHHASGTVRTTVDLLMKDFFTKEPSRILDIWVFEGELSYRRYAAQLFGDNPDTPYGYYDSAEGAMVMNIGLGGGTLVHEIVHPFMETNFPDCPPWFNEGMGSLYEWPEVEDGHIYGVVNWRLEGLVNNIRTGSLGSFKRLMGLSRHQFYSITTSANYAQSRYLLQYLQYKGKLKTYYHAFVKNHKQDPTGLQTLKTTLHITNIHRFQQEWENWVLTLQPGTIPRAQMKAASQPPQEKGPVSHSLRRKN